MADRIVIRGIRGRGFHGVFDHERRQGQEFIVDVSISLDTAPAGSSDDLRRTVDYGQVANVVHAIIEGEPVDLIETVAERIAEAVLRWEAVELVEVTVHKPQAPIEVPFDDVSVSIVRRRGTHD